MATPIRLLCYKIFMALKVYIFSSYVWIMERLSKHRYFKGVPATSTRVAIVTGGSQGIGASVVRRLVTLGYHVIIASTEQQKAKEVIFSIQKALQTDNYKAEFMYLDLASIKSVKLFAEQFINKNLPLHVLINNAGVMYPPYSITEDGFELTMAVNYFGPLLLTRLLLPKLEEGATSRQCGRIVNVSSIVQYVGQLNMADLQSRTCYSSHAAYIQSKLALVMVTYKLQRHLVENASNVTANVLHPGIVDTNLFRHVSTSIRLLKKYIVGKTLKTPNQAADGIVFVATASELEGIGGRYYDNCQDVLSNPISYNVILQDELWEITSKLLGIKL